jgi:hypothetical protein
LTNTTFAGCVGNANRRSTKIWQTRNSATIPDAKMMKIITCRRICHRSSLEAEDFRLGAEAGFFSLDIGIPIIGRLAGGALGTIDPQGIDYIINPGEISISLE